MNILLFYLMGYIDISHFLARLVLESPTARDHSKVNQRTLLILNKAKEDIKNIEQCMENVGIRGFYNTISKQAIEWKSPLPWSAATALGQTCRASRQGH